MSASPAKAKKPVAKKPAKPAEHPSYFDMIAAAIAALKERGGSSRQKISKYIQENYKVGDNLGSQLRLALKRGVASGKLLNAKGKGASGSFKVTKVEKPKATPKKAAAKPKPKKKTTPKKKPAAKKPAAKKAKKPAAKKATKSPKKPVAKKATKKPAKKPAAKKAGAKKPAKKVGAKKAKK